MRSKFWCKLTIWQRSSPVCASCILLQVSEKNLIQAFIQHTLPEKKNILCKYALHNGSAVCNPGYFRVSPSSNGKHTWVSEAPIVQYCGSGFRISFWQHILRQIIYIHHYRCFDIFLSSAFLHTKQEVQRYPSYSASRYFHVHISEITQREHDFGLKIESSGYWQPDPWWIKIVPQGAFSQSR